MNFQKLVSSYTLSETMGNTREEHAIISLLLEQFKEKTIQPQTNELIYEFLNGKEEIAIVKNGYATAIDFVSWDDVLASNVDVSFVEKQTTIDHFIELVLLHMFYEGTNEEKREKRIQILQESVLNSDCDQSSWYEIAETIQGKEHLFTEGSVYNREAFLLEGVRPAQLLEENKAFLW